jgi:hypothetical protein
MAIYNKTLSNRYKVVMKALALRERVGLAGGVYAGRIQQHQGLRLLNQNEVLSINLEKTKINKNWLVFIASALIAVQGANPAHSAAYSVDHLKLYAHSRIVNYKQFQCFNKIITKESRWNYQARNGSHYGLGQMKSKHYGNLDPFRQIDATLAYVTKRYKSNCQAWAFHQRKGYF